MRKQFASRQGSRNSYNVRFDTERGSNSNQKKKKRKMTKNGVNGSVRSIVLSNKVFDIFYRKCVQETDGKETEQITRRATRFYPSTDRFCNGRYGKVKLPCTSSQGAVFLFFLLLRPTNKRKCQSDISLCDRFLSFSAFVPLQQFPSPIWKFQHRLLLKVLSHLIRHVTNVDLWMTMKNYWETKKKKLLRRFCSKEEHFFLKKLFILFIQFPHFLLILFDHKGIGCFV